jgi:hypothetical protein
MNDWSRECDVRNDRWWRSLYFAAPFYDGSHIFSNGGTRERGRVANEQLVTPVETLTLDERGASNDREIWTVGHSTRSIEEFLALLDDYAINLLVDVRSYPGSRRCPQFGRETMSTWLANNAVTYHHARDLGGRRDRQSDVDPAINAAWQSASFRNYADYTLGDAYRTALANLATMVQASRVAFMCSEALPWRCHRSLIADSLVARGFAVHHIMSTRKVIEHRLGQWGPEPTVVAGWSTYPEPRH